MRNLSRSNWKASSTRMELDGRTLRALHSTPAPISDWTYRVAALAAALLLLATAGGAL